MSNSKVNKGQITESCGPQASPKAMVLKLWTSSLSTTWRLVGDASSQPRPWRQGVLNQELWQLGPQNLGFHKPSGDSNKVKIGESGFERLAAPSVVHRLPVWVSPGRLLPTSNHLTADQWISTLGSQDPQVMSM